MRNRQFSRQPFYRDVRLITLCKVCGVEFRPLRGSEHAGLKLCIVHRRIYLNNKQAQWMAKQTPEVKKRYRDMKQRAWRAMVARNIGKRRAIALASYHKNKDKHRGRKHRATQPVTASSH